MAVPCRRLWLLREEHVPEGEEPGWAVVQQVQPLCGMGIHVPDAVPV